MARGSGRDALVLGACLVALAVAGSAWAVRGGSATPIDLGPIVVADEKPPAPLVLEVPPEIVKQLELDERFIALERWTAEHPDDVAGRVSRWREFEAFAVGTPYATLAAPPLAAAVASVDAQIQSVGVAVNAALRLLDWDKAESALAEYLAGVPDLTEAQRGALSEVRTSIRTVREDYEGSSFRMGICGDPVGRRLFPYKGMRILGVEQVATNPSAQFLVLFAPGVSRLALGFDLQVADRRAYLTLNHLQSVHHGLRFARISIAINQQVLATGISPFNGERQAIEVTHLLRSGPNVLELSYDADSLTPYWLNRLEITDRP